MPLGDEYPFEFEKTRMRVLREASNLFAIHGFEGVSMNEIAAAVGIRAPSLYNHFEKKEQILDAIFTMGMEWMDEYYRRFKADDENARSIEESIENIFLEVRTIVDPFGFQVIVLAQRYAGTNPLAYELFHESFYNAGLRSISACLRRGQAKGYVPPGISIEPYATLMMDFVIHNELYGALVGSKAFKHRRTREWYDTMQQYFVNLIKAGV